MASIAKDFSWNELEKLKSLHRRTPVVRFYQSGKCLAKDSHFEMYGRAIVRRYRRGRARRAAFEAGAALFFGFAAGFVFFSFRFL